MPARAKRGRSLTLGLSVFAIVLAGAFVFLFSASFAVYSLGRSSLDKDLYLDAMADQGVFDDFPKLFSEQMNYWINTLKSTTFMAALFFQNVEVSDWELVAEKIVTREWFYDTVNALFSQIFDFANGKEPDLSLSINIEPIKERLGGQVGIDTYHEIVSNKPECSQMELLQWMVAPAFNLLPICKIPASGQIPLLTTADPEEVLADVLKDWSSSLPGEKDLSTWLDEGSRGELKTLFSLIRISRTVSGIILGISFVFLLLTLISPGVRTLVGWLRLWGLSFLSSGILIVVFSMLLALISIWQIRSVVSELTQILHPSVVALVDGVTNRVVPSLISPIFFPAVILVIVGFGMFGVSVIAHSRSG